MEILRPVSSAAVPRKGCNPILSTQRSKIQSQRTVINQQLCKQMRLRAGAENLYNASSNQKVRETVTLELSFVNSNLQLLKEELSELNSAVEPYQNRSGKTVSVPMIPLGLKDTNELNFMSAFETFITSHYGDDANKFADELADYADMRNAIRTPARDQEGVELLIDYYHQVQCVEDRFMPPHRPLGVYYHWYDSITGVPAVQPSVSLEKASVLFNIGALYSQLGTRADRAKRKGINVAIDAFQCAAGVFDYVRSNFSNGPTHDLSPSFLTALTKLMLAQAQECVLERKVLGGFEIQLGKCASISQEAIEVSEKYEAANSSFNAEDIKSYVPYPWINMVQAKTYHYRALAHYYAGVGLLDQHEAAEPLEISKLLSTLYIDGSCDDLDIPTPDAVAQRKEDRRRLGKSHLRQAVFFHERALQTHSLCKMMRTIDILKEYLQHAHNRSLSKFAEVDDEEDFFELIEAPEICPHTEYETAALTPGFSSVHSSDIFHRLGPVSVFSARKRLGRLRTVKLSTQEEKCCFTLQGEGPVTLSTLGELAMELGIHNSDVVVSVNGVDSRWDDHDQIADVISQSGDSPVTMELISVLGTFDSPVNDSNGFSHGAHPAGNDVMRTNADSSSNSVVLRHKLREKARDPAIKKRHSFGLFTGMRLRAKANRVESRFSTIAESPSDYDEYSGTMQPRSAVTVQRSVTSAKYLNSGLATTGRRKSKDDEYRSQC